MDYLNTKKVYRLLLISETIVILHKLFSLYDMQWWFAFLIVIAFALNAFGLRKILKDEKGFNKAYICSILGTIVAIVFLTIIVTTKRGSHLSHISNELFDFLIALFVIKASINVAEKIHNARLISLAEKIETIHLITFFASMILGLCSNQIVISFISAIIGIIGQIAYCALIMKIEKVLLKTYHR